MSLIHEVKNNQLVLQQWTPLYRKTFHGSKQFRVKMTLQIFLSYTVLWKSPYRFALTMERVYYKEMKVSLEEAIGTLLPCFTFIWGAKPFIWFVRKEGLSQHILYINTASLGAVLM